MAASKAKEKAAPKRYAYAGASLGVPAQVVGEELDRIERRDGGVVPRVLVEESEPAEAPLHNQFEWDDAVAAQFHREDQARRIIRSVRVVKTAESGESSRVIAFVSVTRSDDQEAGRHYVSAARAMSDEEMRQQVLAEAVEQLRGWERRYGHLAELAGVRRIISEALNNLA